jgi:hypothetical protein
MESKSLAGEALRHFIHEYGRLQHLTFDGSIEQTGRKTEFMCNILKYAIKHKINFAKGVIWEVRTKWLRIMVKKKVPTPLWDYGFHFVCDIQNGKSVDITEYLDFGFYD